jgi:hypothetical protein
MAGDDVTACPDSVVKTRPSAAFVAGALARVIHQDAAHRGRGHREEVSSAAPLDPLDLDQPHVGLVDKRRRLQRVADALAAHVMVSEPPELLVHDRDERIHRSGGGVHGGGSRS